MPSSKLIASSPAQAARPSTSPAARVRVRQAKAGSKLHQIVALLRSRNGATIATLVKATGWQDHSIRGAIAGVLKKKLGLRVVATTRDGKRVYRVAR